MNKQEKAIKILELIGGKDNVTSVTYCMTRLRITPKDRGLVKDEEIKAIEGIVGSQIVGAQYQVIIGPDVEDVYKEFCKAADIEANVTGNEDDTDNLSIQKDSSAKGLVNRFMDIISACVTPLIPIITAAGLIKLIVAVLGPTMLNVCSESSDIMRLLTFVGDAGFYFYPVFVAYGAAKKFKCNIPLALFFSGILLHPTLNEIVTAGKPFTVFGIPMTLVSYSANFISMILICWVMSYVEKYLTKFTPKPLRALIVPLGTTLIMLPLALCLLGPAGSWLGQGISWAITIIHKVLGPVSIALLAAFWPFLVATGMHQGLIAIAMGNIATFGYDQTIVVGGFLCGYPLIATGLAYVIKTKDKTEKSVALTNWITLAAGGISEPLLFGTILRNKRAILYVILGGLAAGFYAGVTGVAVFLFGSGNVLAVLSFAGAAIPSSLMNGIIAAIIGFVVSFALGIIFGFDDTKAISLKKKVR